MPNTSSEGRAHAPIEYRDAKGRVWRAAEVAQIRVVAPAVDGPNLCLVIRFEREGEERLAHWIGGEDWRQRDALQRLFAEAEPREAAGSQPVAASAASDDGGVGRAPPETIALWVKLVASMGPDALADFEERTFRQWDRASLGDLRRAIDRRRRELAS